MSASRPLGKLEPAGSVDHADRRRLLAFVSPLYEDVALNELRDLVGARLVRPVARGALLLSIPQTPCQTAKRLRERPPIFVRQVLLDVQVAARTRDAGADAGAIAEICRGTSASSLTICDIAGRRQASLDTLADAVMSRLPDTSSHDRSLVAAAPSEYFVGRPIPGAGICGAPFWPGGRPDVPAGAHFVSRSALKLCEALSLFSIPLNVSGTALDLGAAPGGWSQVLAGHGMWVTAVDPGELDPRVSCVPTVRAFRGTAQTFMRTGSEQYDMVVDDMRMDARESARLLVALRQRLRQRATALITLKLPERAPSLVLKPALTTLGATYAILGVRCLYFNRNEVTVYARVPGPDSRLEPRVADCIHV